MDRKRSSRFELEMRAYNNVLQAPIDHHRQRQMALPARHLRKKTTIQRQSGDCLPLEKWPLLECHMWAIKLQ